MNDLVVAVKIIAKYFAVVCFVLALLLLFWPNVFIRTNRILKKWFSTAKFEREMNRTRDIDVQLLNMRKIIGLIAAVLAFIFILILLK